MVDFTDEFQRLIESRFKSEFGIMYPDIPVQFDNGPWKQPEDGPWAAFTFRQNPAVQKTMGRKFLVRTTGFIQIDINVPSETGTKKGRKIADAAADIFAYQKFKGPNVTISCDEKHVDAAQSAGAFYRIMARVFFYYNGERLRISVQSIS